MSLYLCYDLKGIQQYIFQVPKLTCCIGGSRQIDAFDRRSAVENLPSGVKRIYSGGGKGAYICDDESRMALLKQELISRALEKGLTIRFGIDADYTKAAREIKETYCYQPESLEGVPCPLSGLYPTTDKENPHPLIAEREKLGRQHGKESPTEARFLNDLKQKFNKDFSFIYNVNPNDDRATDNTPSGYDGAAALGFRNRWAVVCMDGNDMGLQFLKFKERNPGASEWEAWLPEMSKNLDICTCDAASAGIIAVAQEYLKENKKSRVLPIRPLIIGGDDITILVSCRYANLFVKTAMKKFQEESRKYKNCWVGTDGEMTISAGILYAPVSLPLHSALNFTEMLLASAKTLGRDLKKESGSTRSPACLDWESVTEGLLISPAIRRQKEFRFIDPETKHVVELTSRPYSLPAFEKLQADIQASIEKIPNTILHQIHHGLFDTKSKRLEFYAKLCKNYKDLVKKLHEPWSDENNSYGALWEIKNNIQRTQLVDAILLLQEEKRMEQQTISDGEED